MSGLRPWALVLGLAEAVGINFCSCTYGSNTAYQKLFITTPIDYFLRLVS